MAKAHLPGFNAMRRNLLAIAKNTPGLIFQAVGNPCRQEILAGNWKTRAACTKSQLTREWYASAKVQVGVPALGLQSDRW
ncbi:MAG TPA: hypothetical protein VE133_03280, partial [Candidatus Sulfotelmatobacter sp.]|nr:hypothetical protein [Candidatus Sulfotelmatobacter sp.]